MLRPKPKPFPSEIDFGDLIRLYGLLAAKQRLQAARVAPPKKTKKVRAQKMVPFRGVTKGNTKKYEAIKESALKAGKPLAKAKQIAAATVNAQRKRGQAPITRKKGR
jgi:hypothetical protein